eukprot:gene3276-1607_t
MEVQVVKECANSAQKFSKVYRPLGEVDAREIVSPPTEATPVEDDKSNAMDFFLGKLPVNDSQSDADKFKYLQQSLKGDAAQTISSLPLSRVAKDRYPFFSVLQHFE